MRFDLSQYETVQQRLDKFHQLFPEGRVITQLLEASETRYIIACSLFKDATSLQPFATGLAEETIGSSPVNKTSAIENCETSAIGRALRNGGIGRDASREEMEKVERGDSAPAKKTAKSKVTITQTIENADKCETLEQLRELYSATPAEVLEMPHKYVADGGFEVVGTVADYLKHLAAFLGKEN